MNFQILNGAGLDGAILLQKQDTCLTFNHQAKMVRIPIGSISKIEKNEEFRKEVFFTVTFSDHQTATAKTAKKDYEQIYQLQFHTPKVPFAPYEITNKDLFNENKNNLMLGSIIVLVVCLIFYSSCSNKSSVEASAASYFSPEECNYLSFLGLPTNAYHQQEGEDYLCLANYLEVGHPDPTGAASNLDFAVEGTSSEITDIYLRAIYNNKSSNTAARAKFMQASQELISKTTHQKMPTKLLKAISKGKAFNDTINGKKVTLEINRRDNYDQGKAKGFGYAHQLTIYY